MKGRWEVRRRRRTCRAIDRATLRKIASLRGTCGRTHGDADYTRTYIHAGERKVPLCPPLSPLPRPPSTEEALNWSSRHASAGSVRDLETCLRDAYRRRAHQPSRETQTRTHARTGRRKRIPYVIHKGRAPSFGH